MPEYLSPGVYVEEVSSGIRPIEGVGTSTGAFIGVAEKGPIGGAVYEDDTKGGPQLVTNFGDFVRNFGSFYKGNRLAYAVQQFFTEGGTRCFVTRTAHFDNVADVESLMAKRAKSWFTALQESTVANVNMEDGLKENAETATLDDVSMLRNGMKIKFKGETNGIEVTIVEEPNKKDKTIKFLPAIPTGTTIADKAEVLARPVVLEVLALNEGEWGNNLWVSVSPSGFIETALVGITGGGMVAGATEAIVRDASGIKVDDVLIIRDKVAEVEIKIISKDDKKITFGPIARAIQPGAKVIKKVGDSEEELTTLNMPPLGIAAASTEAVLESLSGIHEGMTLTIFEDDTDARKPAARVQVNRIMVGEKKIIFTVLGQDTVPEIPAGAKVTALIEGKASSVVDGGNQTGKEIRLQSTEGFVVGSILHFVSEKIGETAIHHRAVVERIVGKRVFLDKALPASTSDDTIVMAEDFALTVYEGDDIVETHTNLSLQDTNIADFIEGRINRGSTRSRYIRVVEVGQPPSGGANESNANIPPAATARPLRLGSLPGTEGVDGPMAVKGDYIGSQANQTGFFAFDPVDDINILAAPGETDRDVLLAGMTYCENRGDVFFVGDVPEGLQTVTEVLDFKNATGSYAGRQAFNSKYGAIYWPWVRVFDPVTSKAIPMAPSGAVIGSYSATDVRRGVHKAAAGIEDGFLNSATGIEKIVTKGEHDLLNSQGINVIRSFPGQGILLWGARTVSKDPEWKYINVRRLFLFLEESIDEGTQWVVFEPNDRVLWSRIIRNVSAFLRIQWQEGKLVGNTPEEAFFVKCDEETNPQESIDLGRVITVIGVAPSKPAEFVIFRIMQKKPGAE